MHFNSDIEGGLLLTSFPTISDRLYFNSYCRPDDSIETATGIGMHFHASHGSMSAVGCRPTGW